MKTIVLVGLMSASLLVQSADLDTASRQRIAAGAYQPCLRGAQVSAAHLAMATRETYCRCYSQKMSELVTAADVQYLKKHGKNSKNMMSIAAAASQYCIPR